VLPGFRRQAIANQFNRRSVQERVAMHASLEGSDGLKQIKAPQYLQ
jgi:hypothetical protein